MVVENGVDGAPEARPGRRAGKGSGIWRSAGAALGHWFLRRPGLGGAVGAAVGFAVAMTPSLIPRSWTLQGVLAGLTAAIGYALGSAIGALVRAVSRYEPSVKVKRRSWWVLAIAGAALVIGALSAGAHWDEELRQLMGMDVEEPLNDVGTVAVAAGTAAVLILLGRVLRGLGRLLALAAGRVLPRPVGAVLGGAVAAFLVVYVALGGLAETAFDSVNASAGLYDRTFHPDVDQPTASTRSGSPESLIRWEDLGARGRRFVASGPTAAEIESVAGQDALEPIRVYGGLRSAGSLEGRVELVMAELDRTGAWSRGTVIVQTPSGNGEIPRINADAPELILGGDVAQVALQYSYAPSFTTMVTKPGAGDEAGRRMVDAVVDRVARLPRSDRPRVYVAGESLGSLSTEAAFDDLDDLAATVDGALFVGPTLFNDIRNELTDGRDPDSPVWLPIVDDGEIARFAREPDDLAEPGASWDGSRIVYLQNSSDPVSWFDPRLLWSRPEFLDDPRGPDVSPDMTWIPIVTFWQVVADLPFASGAPDGHGHRFGLNVADGWVAVLRPGGWTSADTTRLRRLLERP